MKSYYLCYINADSRIAYFSERKSVDNWGDDWNDAPYEHNAGRPYDEDFSGPELRVENGRGVYNPIDIKEVQFELPFDYDMPCTGYLNSPYSVEEINSKRIPWIKSDILKIYPDVELQDFKRVIRKLKGKVKIIKK